MRLALLVAALGLAAPLAAQTPGACAHGTATARLNVGDVNAGLFNNGNLFYDGPVAAADYLVAGGQGLYAANFWVGGTVGGDVRTAAATFDNFEFWPGPLDAGATLPAEGCAAYDRIYTVSAADVAAYEATGTATADLAAWPVGLGADAVDAGGEPVVATSRSQTVDLAAGERPVVYGSQTLFWVMNDVGNEHMGTGSAPLGVEVQVTAAGFSGAGPAFDRSTIYRFRIVNRNTAALESAYATLFVDTDLGPDITDERQGVDLPRGMAFTYNENPTDVFFGVPPAMGYDFLSTGVGAHRYAVNGAFYPLVDPQTKMDIYHTQQGLWSDGTPQTAFGNGYQTSGEVTRFAFPGDPVTDQFWSEENANGTGQSLPGSNKRSITSTPAFRLDPGAWTDVHIALVFGQGADRLDSITQLRAASDAIQAAYDAGSLFPVAGETTAPPASALALSAPRPNPTAGTSEIALTLPAAGTARVAVVDVLGREVAVVHEGALAAGTHTLRLPSGLAPGVYAVVAETADARVTQRLTVAR